MATKMKTLTINNVTYDITDDSAVSFVEAQTLTEEQKEQARANIGAAAIGEGGSGGASSWEELTDRPFGSTYEEGAIILPEAEYTPEFIGSGQYGVVIDGSAVTSVPKILVVTIDGARYTLSADEESIAYDIGIYEHQDFGVFIILGEDGFIIFPTEDTHTISIYERIETITQLDAKYLSAIPADKLPTIPADKLPTEMEWYASTEYTEKVIIAERPITPSVLETGVGYLSANLKEMHGIIAGAEVVVSHRAKKIVVVAEEWHDGSVIIGNKYLIDTINPDNGMNFCVVLNELDYVIYDRYTTTALFSLSACVRNTIPVKYLPNIPSYKLDETLISWNNIADKPFYSEQFYFGSARRATEADGGSAADIPHMLMWDGNTTGLTKVGNWYYISTCVPSVEELLDTVTVCVHDGVDGSIAPEPATNIGNFSFISNLVIVARKDNIRWSDYVFPKAGIYVLSDVRWVMIPNYIFPENREVTKKIDEKYLPKSALQPDWNQIANKPFEDMEVVLYDKVGIVPVEVDGVYAIQEPSDLQFVKGNQYIFAFDGVEYTTDTFLLDGYSFGVGNPALMGIGDDNGLPFFAMNNSGNLALVCLSNFTSLSISVIEAKKIDERYLPGAIILYRNNGESGNTDPYLYKKNTGNESDRLTSVELRQFVNSGRAIYIDINGNLFTPLKIAYNQYSRITVYTGATDNPTEDYYTAEYTPAT